MPKRFLILSFTLCALSFPLSCFGLDLTNLKTYFLEGDYKRAILEGEKLMPEVNENTAQLDELYYLLGLSYLKDQNYLRAQDIFEIILNEFEKTKFKEEAKLGLADTYFLLQDYLTAQKYYKDLIKEYPKTKLKAIIYYRLSQCASKLGDLKEAQDYLLKLSQEFPLNLETKLNSHLWEISHLYYTVQVGAFLELSRAKNLMEKLIKEGFAAYIEEIELEDKKNYRVRVGKFLLRKDAEMLKDKLDQAGYPTKIFP